MKIVFYSTNSNFFDGYTFHYTNLPSCARQFEALARSRPEDCFAVVAQPPGMFLLDMHDNLIASRADGVEYVCCTKHSAEEIAGQIAALKPDLAVAVTSWVTPFDWLGIKDALVAACLEKQHIKTICNPADLAMTCFDKWHTRQFLASRGYNVPRAVHIHHELFRAERAHREIRDNNYREYVLQKIKELHYPVIIKDTFGLSSYGTAVVQTFAQAKDFLLSKRNSGDRIAEEYIDGIQAGAEVYGSANNYTVFDPFLFSVNKYGITSPRQSVKLGPVTNPKYNIDGLRRDLLRLSQELHISGCAQFDVVFDGNKWFIIEINPRLSGMSRCVAGANGMTIPELLLLPVTNKKTASAPALVMDIKFPVLPQERLQQIQRFPSVLYTGQTVNDNAAQIREQGYCEVIFGGRNTVRELQNDLENIKRAFPDIMENVFYENALALLAMM